MSGAQLGDQFFKVVTIYQRGLARSIASSYGVTNNDSFDQDKMNIQKFKIYSIHPISARESNTLHLLIVT